MKHALHALPTTTAGSGDSELLRRIADSIDGLREDLRSVLAAVASPSNGADVAAMTHASDAEDQLLTIPELCTLLQIAPRTLQRLRHEGKVPQPIKVGGSLRFLRKDVDRFLARRSAA